MGQARHTKERLSLYTARSSSLFHSATLSLGIEAELHKNLKFWKRKGTGNLKETHFSMIPLYSRDVLHVCWAPTVLLLAKERLF